MIRGNTMDELRNSGIELQLILRENVNIEDSDRFSDANTNANANVNTNVIANVNTNVNYIKSLNEILISVSLHTFIMATFEIYFYFQYIVIVEKELFLRKISEYTIQFNDYYASNINSQQQQLIMILFPQKKTQEVLQIIYDDYQKSLEQQRELLDSLLLTSYKMLVVVTSILVICITTGVYNYKTIIKWKHILIENILMFVCLGIFEYLFFVNIILHFSPITDAEIKYTIAKQLLEPFIGNVTHIQTQKYKYL